MRNVKFWIADIYQFANIKISVVSFKVPLNPWHLEGKHQNYLCYFESPPVGTPFQAMSTKWFRRLKPAVVRQHNMALQNFHWIKPYLDYGCVLFGNTPKAMTIGEAHKNKYLILNIKLIHMKKNLKIHCKTQ